MSNNNWILVTDKLPDEDGKYLVQVSFPNKFDKSDELHIFDFFVKDSEWSNDYFLFIPEVVAWQPLPKLYKKSDSAEETTTKLYVGDHVNVSIIDYTFI